MFVDKKRDIKTDFICVVRSKHLLSILVRCVFESLKCKTCSHFVHYFFNTCEDKSSSYGLRHKLKCFVRFSSIKNLTRVVFGINQTEQRLISVFHSIFLQFLINYPLKSFKYQRSVAIVEKKIISKNTAELQPVGRFWLF
jgi:hypothetical protein